jgi:hypothetical protein
MKEKVIIIILIIIGLNIIIIFIVIIVFVFVRSVLFSLLSLKEDESMCNFGIFFIGTNIIIWGY